MIRELVPKSSKGVTIKRITYYSTYKKFTVQLTSIDMFHSVFSNRSNFGKSMIMETNACITDSNNTTSVIKGVPLSITERDVWKFLANNGFTPDLVQRFSKGQKLTRTIMVRSITSNNKVLSQNNSAKFFICGDCNDLELSEMNLLLIAAINNKVLSQNNNAKFFICDFNDLDTSEMTSMLSPAQHIAGFMTYAKIHCIWCLKM